MNGLEVLGIPGLPTSDLLLLLLLLLCRLALRGFSGQTVLLQACLAGGLLLCKGSAHHVQATANKIGLNAGERINSDFSKENQEGW